MIFFERFFSNIFLFERNFEILFEASSKTNRIWREEKKLWKDENITIEWKIKNLDEITSRMKGWQLETFKESYDHKLKQGISLYKKNLLEK